jgi:hypothetical protein
MEKSKRKYSSNKGHFLWTDQKACAALKLAMGFTMQETAKECGCGMRTISGWKNYPEFMLEIDRLSLLVDVASRAERLRIAMRVIRQRTQEDIIVTARDLLDWLKYVQSETDGANLNLTTIFEALEAETGAREQLIRSGRVSELPEEI